MSDLPSSSPFQSSPDMDLQASPFPYSPSPLFGPSEPPDLRDMDQYLAEDLVSTSGSSESSGKTKRLWTEEEVNRLETFLQEQSQHRKICRKDWEEFSCTMGRSVTSLVSKAALLKKARSQHKEAVRSKPTLHALIAHALTSFPDYSASKAAIVEAVHRLNPQLSGDIWQRSVKQLLSSHFKRVPGRYSLLAGVKAKPAGKCSTMTDYIVWTLRDGQWRTLSQIKEEIEREFAATLNCEVTSASNLRTWEKTLLKKLKVSPGVDLSLSTTLFTFQVRTI